MHSVDTFEKYATAAGVDSEIEEAFHNLTNDAAQYAHRRY